MHYYDFHENWKEFLKAWQHPDIQMQLEADLEDWGYLEQHPQWQRGEPIWNLSDMCICISDSFLEKAVHDPHCQQDVLHASTVKQYVNIQDRYHAKLAAGNDVESYVLVGGTQAVAPAMLSAACTLMPEKTWYMIAGDKISTIWSPNDNIMFDLTAYFHHQQNAGLTAMKLYEVAVGLDQTHRRMSNLRVKITKYDPKDQTKRVLKRNCLRNRNRFQSREDVSNENS